MFPQPSKKEWKKKKVYTQPHICFSNDNGFVVHAIYRSHKNDKK